MLTVKHVIDGREYIYSARSVAFEPEHNPAISLGDYSPAEPKFPCKCVVAHVERRLSHGGYGTDTFGITEGVVYVMNETGKTISRYDMRPGGWN